MHHLKPLPPLPPHPYIKEDKKRQQYPQTTQTNLCYFCLLHTKGKVFPLLEGLESSFWGQIVVEFNFQSTGEDYRCGGRTLTVER